MAAITETRAHPQGSKGALPAGVRNFLSNFGGTGLTLLVLLIFLMPLGYGISTSLKTDSQISEAGGPAVVPSSPKTFAYDCMVGAEMFLLDGTRTSLR